MLPSQKSYIPRGYARKRALRRSESAATMAMGLSMPCTTALCRPITQNLSGRERTPLGVGSLKWMLHVALDEAFYVFYANS